MKVSLLRLLLIAATLAGVSTAPAAPFELQSGDRVLFIGDTFFEREVDFGHIETRLTAAFPNLNVTYRNLAWSGDTPTGRARASFDWNKSEDEWLKRVKEQVMLVKPTVAILSYGMTAVLEIGEAKTPAERQLKAAQFRSGLEALMDAIEAASGEKVAFVILGPTPIGAHEGMNPALHDSHSTAMAHVEFTLLQTARARGAGFHSLLTWPAGTFDGKAGLSTSDGVHLTETAYETVADMLVKDLFGGEKMKSGAPYDLLRSAIQKKNELFFHRWRPENWTYLFGFRKHEQGKNAGEIPKFDPIIKEWETRIAGLRDLKRQDKATVKEVKSLLAAKPRQHHDPNFKAQPVPTFEVAEGFEVTLWAENPLLYKPIQMNWDEKGRLWVASSRVYPQIQPGQDAEDAVIVLEDKNGDGKAETSKVFADGLLIPTGVLPDNHGGCYVAASHQLLHFADKNRDGKADEKTIVMTSFGTEDTHHNLHTLRWGYDGHLYMNQSIYTHTHVETPYGVRRLNSAGIWRFNPDSFRLDIFTKGGCNPWGHHWNQFGSDFFTDGAGGKGIYHAMEGGTYFTYSDMRREGDSITPGSWPKFCSVEVIRSPNFPAEWQGDALTCDFRTHRVVRFKLNEAGSTFAGKEMPDLLRSTNVTFRPIDLRMGPDGALYIADWSNPIIQHGEVDFRDPRRDHEHGRIWRVTAKGSKPIKRQDLSKANIAKLLDKTLSADGWEQEQARRVAALKLYPKTPEEAADEIRDWLGKQKDARAVLEALWMNESLGIFDDMILGKVVTASDANFRAAGARFLANNPEFPNAATRLADLVRDNSPRVRVEALRALGKIPTAKSAELALAALDQPMDGTLDYALWLTINDLAEPWIAAIQKGIWKPDGREKQLEFGVRAIKSEQASRVLGQILATRPLTSDGKGPWIELIGSAGTPRELRLLWEQVLQNGFDDAATARALKALGEASRLRKQKPEGDNPGVGKLFDHRNENVRLEALKLAGEWKELGKYFPRLGELAASSSPALRQAAFTTLRQIGGTGATTTLVNLIAPGNEWSVRREAVVALAAVDLNAALPHALDVANATEDEAAALELWRGILGVKGATTALRNAMPNWNLPGPVAKAGMRAAREGGRNDIELVVAFAKAGALPADTTALTGEVIKELAAKAAKSGNAARGEFVYRRTELACITCHAIGGAGGKVGPDLTSIGASAPVDYLVEALLAPSAKIKEGYASVNIDTKDDQTISGTLARETPDEVVLRSATGTEINVAKQNISSRQNGTVSLMPSGILDNLTEREKLDLIAFLSRLGKPGEYDASKGGIARAWRIYPLTHTDQQNGLAGGVWEKALTDKMWSPTFARVNGKLTREIIEDTGRRSPWVGTLDVFAATELQLARAGEVRFTLDATAGEVWVDGKKIGGPGESTAELPGGKHRVVVKINPKQVPDTISLRASDGAFLSN